MKIKYPRTHHLPWSLGATDDDKTLSSTDHFTGREVVVTEKMDGENTTIYAGGACHARSLDSKAHPARTWVRALAATVGREIPAGWRVCGENLYARHSIGYDGLPTYFMVFGIYDGDNRCLSWDETLEWCSLLGLTPVPVRYRGVWDEKAIKACHTGTSACGGIQEGYVVRVADAFGYDDFNTSVAKFVRKNHVTTDTHWMHAAVVPNKVA